eukprot:CAMPEP_0198217288 /NCGR_PEP_ID=MMETSP1445-20131203/62686_1 /TAXON_ID=36898 /ORGANISM="Pyramimonas sp., Strain CCMP2087" /LENGTH=232 /DNA_ID=CAMNT_0043893907 /DNA_START=49 /DNA_END=744 /DNA_ORIENTATION=+
MQATTQASKVCASHLAVTFICNQRAGRTVENSGRPCIGSDRALYASSKSGFVWSFENLLNARRTSVGVRAHPTRSNVQASIEGQENEKSRGKAQRRDTRTGGAGRRFQITPRKADDPTKAAPRNDPTKWSDDLATGVLADLIRGQKESKTVASVLEIHRDYITAQCLRDLLDKLAQSKPQRVRRMALGVFDWAKGNARLKLDSRHFNQVIQTLGKEKLWQEALNTFKDLKDY